MRIIEFFSGVWGGAYNIIVPTDGKDLAKDFWKILSAYDADYIYYYRKTARDLKTTRPERYDAWLNAQLGSLLAGGQRDKIDFARQQIEDFAVTDYLTPELTSEFQLEIRQRLAPFHVLDNVVDGIISDFPPRFPLAPIVTVMSGSDERPELGAFSPSYQGVYPLWLAAVTGSVSQSLRDDLERLGSAVHSIPTSDYSIELVTSERARNAFTSAGTMMTPFQLTNLGLGIYRSVKSSFLRGPMIVVAGQTLDDFCLYYCLARLREPVLWLPHAWLKAERTGGGTSLFDLFIQSLRKLLHGVDTTSKCILTSNSLDETQLKGLIKGLEAANSFQAEGLHASTHGGFELDELIRRPFRVFEAGNASRPTPVIAQESAEIDLFETPKPKNFPKIHPHEHRWITDVVVSGHYLPRNPALGEWAIRSPILGSHGARVGAGTLSYFCPNIGYAGGDIDSTMVRPTIFVPSTLQTFERMFWSVGYEAKLSDKGFFAHETISKFGGLAAIGSFLRDPFTRKLLLKFLDSFETGTLNDDGCLLNDQRRYLHLPSVSKILGSDKGGQKIIERLMLEGILYRGCIFKCRFCRNADWFGLDEFSQTFKCKRCGATQHSSSENYWYAENEPGWFYKLDEIVYQFLHHNGYVTCLALDCLRARSEDSFLFTGDLELVKSAADSRKPEFELDIVGVLDSEVVLGEAKKSDSLSKKEIMKYLHLAKKVGANKLVFATFAENWSAETHNNIDKIIRAAEIEPIIFCNSNLLSGQ